MPAASLAYRLAALAWLLPGADNVARERLHNIADLLHGARRPRWRRAGRVLIEGTR
jgi:hypothetical protein